MNKLFSQLTKLPLRVEQPASPADGPILVADADNNDVADFYHCEHNTVSQTYEAALAYAELLVAAANEGCHA